jgi:hypothetical protein
MLIAGEASGDLLAAERVAALVIRKTTEKTLVFSNFNLTGRRPIPTGQVTAFAGRISMVKTRQSMAAGRLSRVTGALARVKTAQTMATGRPPVVKTKQSMPVGRLPMAAGRVTVVKTRPPMSVGRQEVFIGKVTIGVGRPMVAVETPAVWKTGDLGLAGPSSTAFPEFGNSSGALFRINLCASASLR